jgi:hypothetical protein
LKSLEIEAKIDRQPNIAADYFYLGIGTDLHYEYLYGKTNSETFNKDIFSAGLHLKFLFNMIM